MARPRRPAAGGVVIRILLADDQPLVRAGFGAVLAAEDDFEVVGEAADGERAVAEARRLAPDVVLMDVRMPHLDGLEATARITADPALAATRVVVLTTFELDDYVFGALKAGAAGFLLKDIEPLDLIAAVRTIHRGEALLAPRITQQLITAYVAAGPRSARADTAVLNALTDRERQVLTLVGAGLSNDQIAQRLVISPLTAKTHVSRLFTKLDARDRAQLVVLAYETGLVIAGSAQ
jgi:DNA-binding NarL/FixJ family response regulator